MVSAAATGVTSDFVRLSPWSILHFAARTIIQLLSNAIAVIPVVYGLYRTGSALLTIAAIAGSIALVVLSATLRYRHFSYLIDDSNVQVKQGVFSKTQLNLQFHRIQNVNIEHPFYFRPLGLVTVRIDGAGSSSEEVSLAALKLERGEQIREQIRRQHRSSDTESADPVGDAPSTPESRLMLTRSLSDLVVHGLTNNRAWIILGALGALYGQASENINTFIAGFGFDLGGFVAGTDVITLAAIAVSAVMIALLFVAVLSVLGSIFSYYGYELYRTPDAFMVRRGLVTRHEINMKKSRIQAVRIRRDWLDMILGRMNVVFEQISHAAPGQVNGGDSKHILVPSVESTHTDQLTNEALSADRLEHLEFTPVSRRYFSKRAAITAACYLVPVIVVVDFALLPLIWLLSLLPVLAINLSLLYMNWKRWGLAVDDGIVVIRKGVIGVDHILIKAFKVQEVGRLRTPLMKRHGLCSVSFSVASRKVSVPFLPEQVVSRALDYCLYEAESANRSWM